MKVGKHVACIKASGNTFHFLLLLEANIGFNFEDVGVDK